MPTDDTNVCFNTSGPTQIIMVSSGPPINTDEAQIIGAPPSFFICSL